jgi:hypothetical protein
MMKSTTSAKRKTGCRSQEQLTKIAAESAILLFPPNQAQAPKKSVRSCSLLSPPDLPLSLAGFQSSKKVLVQEPVIDTDLTISGSSICPDVTPFHALSRMSTGGPPSSLQSLMLANVETQV